MEEKDLDYLRAFVAAAYERSPDAEFRAYIQSQMDYIRDHPTETYTWKTLMSRASKKVDAMKQAATHAALSNTPMEDPILTLQAETRQHKKTIDQLTKQAKQVAKTGSDGGGRKPQAKATDKDRIPFPKELKKKPEPSDTSCYEVHDGAKYWWCTKHKHWGRHPTSECKKGTGQSPGKNGKCGDRFVKALAAVTDPDK